MSDRPAYHCGALDCCEGNTFPECQACTTVCHYDDTSTGEMQIPHTD